MTLKPDNHVFLNYLPFYFHFMNLINNNDDPRRRKTTDAADTDP